MKPLYKGLLLAGLHLALVLSLGGKLLYDRATCPRGWAKAAPYDPDLPIRGRYVSLQLEVDAPGIRLPELPPQTGTARVLGPTLAVRLSGENGRLVARRDPQAEREPYSRRDEVTFRHGADGRWSAVLHRPVLYFIPEHVKDPSRRAAGEELWVEVTLPKKGPPRPIRLGVKKGDAPITPLDID